MDQARDDDGVTGVCDRENTELPMLRSPSKLAAIVAATTPTTTGHCAAGTRAIKIPEATPATGQNTATPLTGSSKVRLSRAVQKINQCHSDGQNSVCPACQWLAS